LRNWIKLNDPSTESLRCRQLRRPFDFHGSSVREIYPDDKTVTIRILTRSKIRSAIKTLKLGEFMADVHVALWVRLDAKPGKEKEVADFLRGGLAIVQEEPATTAWFAIQLAPSTFGIFDAFPNEAGRQAHLSGRVAAALMAKASELLAKPPAIEKIDVLAAKLPK
jgi:quinol monooxygenase YgiN